MKVAIVDFDDSFTFNIFSILSSLNVEAHIIHYKKVRPEYLWTFTHIILGPGPGHVDDYRNIFPLVDMLILDSFEKKFKLIGICLGHQLIHLSLGRKIKALKKPVHGQSFSFKLPNSEFLREELREVDIELQFYNSWIVENTTSHFDFNLEIYGINQEVIASFSENITTYQFHCESIGTSCQRDLFLQFLV